MNKTELIAAIAAETGFTKIDSKKALDGIVDSISQALKANDNVILTGFGTFKTATRAARKGRNPQTGKEIQIKAKKVVSFKTGSELSDSVQ